MFTIPHTHWAYLHLSSFIPGSSQAFPCTVLPVLRKECLSHRGSFPLGHQLKKPDPGFPKQYHAFYNSLSCSLLSYSQEMAGR